MLSKRCAAWFFKQNLKYFGLLMLIMEMFMKKATFLLSALMILGTVTAHAEFDHFELDRDTVVLVDSRKEKMVYDVYEGGYGIVPLNDQVIEKDESAKSTWKSTLTSGAYALGMGTANLGLSALKLGANTLLNASTDMVEWGLRTAIAYNVAYYDTKAIEWVACKGVNCAFSLAFGFPAGAGAEAALDFVFKLGHIFVPGYEALIAGAATPFVKPVTDFAINSTPTVLKAAGNAAKSMWSFGRNAASYFSSMMQSAAAA
jgi:hypothetical protein